MLLRGDLIKFLLIIPKGTKKEIVHACLNSPSPWQKFQILSIK
jgi:hypothetical protein